MDWIESLKNYQPCNEQEQKDKNLFFHCINTFADILSRDSEIAHVTSSAFVVNHTKDKMLMVHHNIYNSWSWTGGHADGNEDLLEVAMQEATEETGIKNIRPATPDIFALDVLPVLGHFKNGQYVSAHLHLSVAFLVIAAEDEPLTGKADENSAVAWIPIDEVLRCTSEPHMQKVYSKLIAKLKSQVYPI
jgi:8-oxo-dGTP pyrophosphatase MutT (NUDIX family)